MKIYVVGGFCRDTILGKTPKDKDFVICGATPQDLLDLKFQQVGCDFPVFLHPITSDEFALARQERKTGSGYHGFETNHSPSVTLEEDLRRRDLTCNSIAMEVDPIVLTTGEFKTIGNFIDPFNGMRDLEYGMLRHVSEAFAEDPVRVLRVARFAARYNFNVAAETLELMNTLAKSSELNELTPERVFAEFEKALMEDFPINFFRVLAVVEADKVLFPELVPEVMRPLMVVESLDRAVMLKMDFLSRVVVLCAGLKTESILGMFKRLKAPSAATTLVRMSNTLIERLLHVDFENGVDGYADVLDEIHAWRLPEVFLKVMQSLVAFDNIFIQKAVFDLLKLHREGSKANFDMLSDEQKATLKGKEIGKEIADLRRKLMWEWVT